MLPRPANLGPVGDERFQSENAMAMPSSSGMTVSETTKSAAGSTNRMRLPCSPRMSTWPDAQADAPGDVGDERRLPVLEAEVQERPAPGAPGAQHDDQQHEERAADEESSQSRPRAAEMSSVRDDVDEVAGAAHGQWSIGAIWRGWRRPAVRRRGARRPRTSPFTVRRRTRGTRRAATPPPSSQTQRGPVELELAVAADLVGDLLPAGLDGVRDLLRGGAAAEALDELVLGAASSTGRCPGCAARWPRSGGCSCRRSRRGSPR